MTEQFTNQAQAVLATTLPNNGTTVDVVLQSNGNLFPATGNFRIYIAGEWLLAQGRSGNTLLSCLRAQEGSSFAAHIAGALVEHRLSAGAIAQTITDRIQVSEARTRDLSDAQVFTDGAGAYYRDNMAQVTTGYAAGTPLNVPLQAAINALGTNNASLTNGGLIEVAPPHGTARGADLEVKAEIICYTGDHIVGPGPHVNVKAVGGAGGFPTEAANGIKGTRADKWEDPYSMFNAYICSRYEIEHFRLDCNSVAEVGLLHLRQDASVVPGRSWIHHMHVENYTACAYQSGKKTVDSSTFSGQVHWDACQSRGAVGGKDKPTMCFGIFAGDQQLGSGNDMTCTNFEDYCVYVGNGSVQVGEGSHYGNFGPRGMTGAFYIAGGGNNLIEGRYLDNIQGGPAIRIAADAKAAPDTMIQMAWFHGVMTTDALISAIVVGEKVSKYTVTSVARQSGNVFRVNISGTFGGGAPPTHANGGSVVALNNMTPTTFNATVPVVGSSTTYVDVDFGSTDPGTSTTTDGRMQIGEPAGFNCERTHISGCHGAAINSSQRWRSIVRTVTPTGASPKDPALSMMMDDNVFFESAAFYTGTRPSGFGENNQIVNVGVQTFSKRFKTKVGAGATIADSDFPNGSGSHAIDGYRGAVRDTTAAKDFDYVRSNGIWKRVEVT